MSEQDFLQNQHFFRPQHPLPRPPRGYPDQSGRFDPFPPSREGYTSPPRCSGYHARPDGHFEGGHDGPRRYDVPFGRPSPSSGYRGRREFPTSTHIPAYQPTKQETCSSCQGLEVNVTESDNPWEAPIDARGEKGDSQASAVSRSSEMTSVTQPRVSLDYRW